MNNGFTEVPTRFVSKTMYNPNMVLVHLDQMKDCIKELQDELLAIKSKLEDKKSTKKSTE